MAQATKYFWYKIDLVIFVILNAILLWLLWNRLPLVRLDWLRLIVFGLAVFRVANVISNEQLTKPIRAPFVNEEQKNGKTIEVPKKRGFLGAMGSLIYCPSCTGTWIAAAIFYCYVFWPAPTYVMVVIFALSGMERIFTSAYNFLKK